MTPTEIRSRGLKALFDALGFVGMVRFLHQFDSGSGDYTRDRDQWLGNPTVQELAAEIRASQQENTEAI
ncbi:MAG: hypothetical protein AAFR42_03650 [Cyanobacteria bacterium J06628_6]